MTDWRIDVAAALALAAAPLAASAQTVGYTVGLAGVRGTYPGERLDSAYVFHTIDASAGAIRASLTVPWVRVASTPELGAPATLSGVGDPLLRADVRVAASAAGGWQLSLAAAVKPPIVNAETGRGTGELDVAGGATALKVMGRTSLLADLLYWKYGDPEGAAFPDTLVYSVGVARRLGGGRWSMLSSLSGSTAPVGDLDPPVAVTMAVLAMVGRRQSVVLSATAGLTNGASDLAVGASWRVAR